VAPSDTSRVPPINSAKPREVDNVNDVHEKGFSTSTQVFQVESGRVKPGNNKSTRQAPLHTNVKTGSTKLPLSGASIQDNINESMVDIVLSDIHVDTPIPGAVLDTEPLRAPQQRVDKETKAKERGIKQREEAVTHRERELGDIIQRAGTQQARNIQLESQVRELRDTVRKMSVSTNTQPNTQSPPSTYPQPKSQYRNPQEPPFTHPPPHQDTPLQPPPHQNIPPQPTSHSSMPTQFSPFSQTPPAYPYPPPPPFPNPPPGIYTRPQPIFAPYSQPGGDQFYGQFGPSRMYPNMGNSLLHEENLQAKIQREVERQFTLHRLQMLEQENLVLKHQLSTTLPTYGADYRQPQGATHRGHGKRRPGGNRASQSSDIKSGPPPTPLVPIAQSHAL
jgi:hypothetical protein